jgi:hypothetical protein
MARPTLLVAPAKSLSSFPGWSRARVGDGYVWFNAPLEVGGVTMPGLFLHGGCYINQPERHVTLELRLAKTPGRRIRPLERIDWRSMRGGHHNLRRKGHPLSGVSVSPTHLHAFDQNYDGQRDRFLGEDLPFAQEIDVEMQTFVDLLAFAAFRFKINNINVVETPQWAYILGLEQP